MLRAEKHLHGASRRRTMDCAPRFQAGGRIGVCYEKGVVLKPWQRLGVNLASAGMLGAMIACMAWAADDAVADRIAKHLESERKARETELAKFDAQIARILNDKRKAEAAIIRRGVTRAATEKRPAVYPSKKIKDGVIANLDSTLRLTKEQRAIAADKPIMQPYIESLKVGEGGRFPGWKFRVVQVINKRAMLADVESLGTFLLRDMPTEGFADDSEIETVNYFEVTGTESYTTVTGAKRTVFVVRPFDEKRLEALKKKP